MELHTYLKKEHRLFEKILTHLQKLNEFNKRLKEALGETLIAEHCQVVNYVDGSLIVIVDSPHWLIHIRFLIPELLKKLRKFSELADIRAICCKVYPIYQPLTQQSLRPAQCLLSAESSKSLLEVANKMEKGMLEKVLRKIAARQQK